MLYLNFLTRVLLLSFAFPSLSPRAHLTPRDVSGLLKPIQERHKIPGMVAAIVEGDQVIALGAVGVRKAGSPEPVQIGDLFHLGSCTKAMTATMIATLVEERKISWETTLEKVFSPWPDRWNAAWRNVTLEQLLTHRSGAPSDLGADGLWGKLWNRKGTPTEQRMDLVEGVLSRPPLHEPGTKYLYANAGFAIAGAMAEKITGEAWEDLMRKRLFEPLGMTTAGFGAPGTPGVVDQPRGHRKGGAPVELGRDADNPPAIGPAGTVHCSIGDWAKFVALHLQGDRGEARLLSAKTFAKLHAPFKGPDPQYAMGWGVTERPWGGGRVLTHNGSNTMWFCVVWIAPKKNFAVLVACNQAENGDKATDEAAWALIQNYLAEVNK